VNQPRQLHDDEQYLIKMGYGHLLERLHTIIRLLELDLNTKREQIQGLVRERNERDNTKPVLG
jgi:hypothetical protein